MKIAFLTDQYVTDDKNEGGVGNYLAKMGAALSKHGHHVEVFALVNHPHNTTIVNGITIHSIKKPDSILFKVLKRLILYLFSQEAYENINTIIYSYILNKAFEKRDKNIKFDIVQSTNYPQTGFFVKRKQGRKHYLRLSTSRLLFDKASFKKIKLSQKITEKIDLHCIRKADHSYSPSQFLSDYFEKKYALDISVVRPPAILYIDPAKKIPFNLPKRYLVHFGILGFRKGTDLVAEALEKAWKSNPDLKMVWVGRYSQDIGTPIHEKLEDTKERLIWIDHQPSSQLYKIVSDSIASVLPSRADNLPNTVIESLLLGVPVIGFSNASIDELVIAGKNGELVPSNDTDALAIAMIQAWDENKDWLNGNMTHLPVFDEMQAEQAVKNFLELESQ
ncbi:glycosyltransferase family 4 protein [Aliifodinibius salicampi]|uniref:Glycosyltransferase family 4 protein n=1 Tax=Fodinibius salicampi TaxID=1920655 RepID=A0ABT3PV95_9BACT|nr:glycosyltransferase family 4 protein [Fodinibius salicampi]MCW9711748.1 glycosyltransferase family 4 protein [Fodinibius salicampi]